MRSIGGDNGTVQNSLLGFCAGSGVALKSTSNGWLVGGNEIRGGAIGNSTLDGVQVETGSSGATVRGNLIAGIEGNGIDTSATGGSLTIVNNTVTGNGIGAAPVETSGIRVFGSGTVVDRNVVNANFGAGILVPSSGGGDTFTRNSIYLNGTILNKAGGGPSNQLGIDLLSAADDQLKGTAPYFTLNDSGDADAGGNALLNFAVLTEAQISGTTLTLRGYTRPGTTVEVFIADADPSGFGEGKTFALSGLEGGPADLDGGSGTYGPGPVNGLVQGTDTTNRFTFNATPVPPGVALGTALVATATSASGTSEFSGPVVPVRPGLVKRAFLADGTPLADGVTLPKGTIVKFLLYVNNPGGAVTDVSIADPLAAGFSYVSGSLKYSNSVASCAGLDCTAPEEAAVLAAADAGALGTDAVDGDVVSFTSSTVYVGNQVVANAQLNIAATRVFAVLLTVRMQ